jgi:hypothetical protein
MSVCTGGILKFFCGVTSTKDQKKGCNVIVPLQAYKIPGIAAR